MRNFILVSVFVAMLAIAMAPIASAQSAPPRVVAWNDLGMHCMDPDFSIFSILPPYNTVNAHLVLNGKLVKTGVGYTLTYEGVKDANQSINTTSIGKTTPDGTGSRARGFRSHRSTTRGRRTRIR